MPTIERSEWLKLPPKEKLLHRAQRVTDGLQKAQNDYRRDRATGKITTPIPFFEESD